MKKYVRKTTNPKMGRPTVIIDKEQFEKLCQLQCTLDEMAGWFKCSQDTIENWCLRSFGRTFSDIYKSYSSVGKISLRRFQFKLAETNVSMAIWLGKQYLGQKDFDDATGIPRIEIISEVPSDDDGKKNP